MILQGSQRGGARDLALHLLKDENEHIDVHELRGFMSDDLVSALKEAEIISKGTKAKQFLFSLSLNPPANENVSTEDFKNAIGKVEKELGLLDQPRAIAFHEKNGRRHCHAVWSRINVQEMKAIPLPYTKLKLKEISKELYLEHGWEMPRGFIDRQNRDPNNYSLAQWQQAQRIGKHPKEIKQALQDAWAVSDDRPSFEAALKGRGYHLAKGDRRGFVAMDSACEPYSVSKKWVGVKAQEVRNKLGDSETLLSVEQTRAKIAKNMHRHLQDLKTHRGDKIDARKKLIRDKLTILVSQQQHERDNQKQAHEQRWQLETHKRQALFNTGIKGLVDRVTGQYRKLQKQNERESYLAMQRDQSEKDNLIFKHIDQRQALQQRSERLQQFEQSQAPKLNHDIQQYKEIMQNKRDTFERVQTQSQNHSTEQTRTQNQTQVQAPTQTPERER